MSDLTGSTISSTYNLLLTTESAVMGSSLQSIESGTGVPSALKLSTAAVSVNGSLTVGTETAGEALTVQGDDSGCADFISDCSALGNAQIHIQGRTDTANHLYLGYNTSSDSAFIQGVTDAVGYRDLIINENGGNVGIGGTPTSSGQLDVLSSNTNITPSSVAGAGISLRNTHATDDNYSFIRFDAASGNIGSGIFGVTTNQTSSYGELSFATVGSGGFTEAMRIDSSGNVKIGDSTTDFTSKLTVSGNGSVDTGLFMYNGDAGTYLAIETGAADGVVNLKAQARSGAAPALTFETGEPSAERMRIDSSGNVGIEVTPNTEWWAQDTALQLGGTATFGSNTVAGAGNELLIGVNTVQRATDDMYLVEDEASRYKQQHGTHAWQYAASGAADSVISWSTGLFQDASGNVTMTADDPVLKVEATGSDKHSVLNLHPEGTGKSQIQRAGTNVITINSSNYVGIGTTGPDELLHVEAGSPFIQLESTTNGGTAGIKYVDDGGTHRFTTGFDDTTNTYRIAVGDGLTTTPVAVDSSGNVGIGASTTTEMAGNKLTIRGPHRSGSDQPWQLEIDNSDATAADKGGGIAFGGSYGADTNPTYFANIAGLKENGTSTETGGYLSFSTRTNGGGYTTERMRIDSSGNVNISSAVLDLGTDANGVINADAGMRINIDADGDATGENFTVGKDQRTAAATNILFQVREDGNVLMPDLPDADPGIAGALYHSSGTVMISL